MASSQTFPWTRFLLPRKDKNVLASNNELLVFFAYFSPHSNEERSGPHTTYVRHNEARSHPFIWHKTRFDIPRILGYSHEGLTPDAASRHTNIQTQTHIPSLSTYHQPRPTVTVPRGGRRQWCDDGWTTTNLTRCPVLRPRSSSFVKMRCGRGGSRLAGGRLVELWGYFIQIPACVPFSRGAGCPARILGPEDTQSHCRGNGTAISSHCVRGKGRRQWRLSAAPGRGWAP